MIELWVRADRSSGNRGQGVHARTGWVEGVDVLVRAIHHL